MYAKVLTAHVLGIEAVPIELEVDISMFGQLKFNVVGLAEGAVKESKERVQAALKNLDFNIFSSGITINLAPADIKKEGGHYDLPMAVGLLSAHFNNIFDLDSTLFIGELSLDGTLRGVSGTLCMVTWAKNAGIKRVILPKENADEAALVPGIEIYPFEHLANIIQFLQGKIVVEPYKIDIAAQFEFDTEYDNDFLDVKGQHTARRAAEIAAAGLHNLLMIGSPGSGKTMIARRINSILPPMELSEALLTTKVHSVAGLLKNSDALIRRRPFIAPHHTASDVAIIGGGPKAKPGNVSLATNGVLFLDEMLEFSRSVLEVLRQPLEDGNVTVARAGRTVTYPANFMLVSATNPCPCGYYGDPKRRCVCTPQAVARYKGRLSGPLLDRIDLHVLLVGVDYSDLKKLEQGESSKTIRQRVINAHNIQKERFKGTDVNFNSQMREKMLRDFCMLDDKAAKIIESAMLKFSLSARAHSKILKTARTIADLSDSKNVQGAHILEALQFRVLDKED